MTAVHATRPRDTGPGTRTVRRLLVRLLAAVVVLTSPAWIHGAVTQAPAMATWWNVVVLVTVGVGALDVVASAVVGVTVRGPASVFAGAVALAVVTWPAGVVDEVAAATRLPWLWLVLPPALAAVAVLDSLAISIGYGATVAAVFVSYRPLDLGGAGPVGIVIAEGVLLLVIAVGLALMVRTATAAASRVDDDAARAAAARAGAASMAAAAAARADVDAVVHDRVLSALTVVAGSPTSPLIPGLAREALDALAGPDGQPPAGSSGVAAVTAGSDAPEAPVGLDTLTATVAEAVAAVSPAVRLSGPDCAAPVRSPVVPGAGRGGGVPDEVARAMAEAAAEAVRNSVRHGGGDDGAPAAVTVVVTEGPPPARVTVEIRDDGRGFVPAAVPPGRLGLQVSVRGRMRGVGGRAEVLSHPGRGTVVRLVWPDGGGGAPGTGAAGR